MKTRLQKRNISLLAGLALAFVLLTTSPDIQAQSVDRTILVEQITSASCGPCAAYNPAFDDLINAQAQDRVAIVKYQYDGGAYQDLMGEFNSADVSARIFTFYGGNAFPTCWIQGNYHGNITTVNQATLDSYLSDPAWFDINIEQEVVGDSLHVAADFTALKDFQEGTDNFLRVWVVLIEEVVEYGPGDPTPGLNGEREFHWVMRDMLPGNAGLPIGKQFNGDITSVDYSYWIDQTEIDPSQLRAVAFVQNYGSKEVHNSIMWREGINTPPSGIDNPVISSAKAYPTIVDNFITLEFGLSQSEDLRFELYNINGQLMETLGTESYPSGTHTRSFVLRDLPNGSYFAHIRGQENGETIRFVVQH